MAQSTLKNKQCRLRVASAHSGTGYFYGSEQMLSQDVRTCLHTSTRYHSTSTLFIMEFECGWSLRLTIVLELLSSRPCVCQKTMTMARRTKRGSFLSSNTPDASCSQMKNALSLVLGTSPFEKQRKASEN